MAASAAAAGVVTVDGGGNVTALLITRLHGVLATLLSSGPDSCFRAFLRRYKQILLVNIQALLASIYSSYHPSACTRYQIPQPPKPTLVVCITC